MPRGPHCTPAQALYPKAGPSPPNPEVDKPRPNSFLSPTRDQLITCGLGREDHRSQGKTARRTNSSPTTGTEKAELVDLTDPKLPTDIVKISREEREVGGKRTEKLTSETERKKQTHEWIW